jgi:hypothetical protein
MTKGHLPSVSQKGSRWEYSYFVSQVTLCALKAAARGMFQRGAEHVVHGDLELAALLRVLELNLLASVN